MASNKSNQNGVVLSKTLKLGDKIILTRDYTTTWTRKKFSAGASLIVIRIHKGFLRGVTHVTVRDPKSGRILKEVPWEYFRVD